MHDVGLSTEARDFLARQVKSETPTDFARMEDVRSETNRGFAAYSERAVLRHDLERTDVVIAGVDCERIVSAAAESVSGTLLYLFGGAFMVGDPTSDLAIIGALSHWIGIEVVAPKYRLAPENPAPAAIEDCMAVYREVADDAGPRLLVAGESAGGNLALLVAQAARDESIRTPDALALLSPAVDLRGDAELFEPTRLADPTLSIARHAEVARVYLLDTDPASPRVSPLFGSMAGLAPTIITTGTRDLLMAMCLRLERKMRRAGVDVTTRVWDGLWHVFEFYDDYPESEESLREIADFLRLAST